MTHEEMLVLADLKRLCSEAPAFALEPVGKPRAGAPGAQTTTGGVVVVTDSSTIGSSSALPDAAWITGCIRRGFTNRLLGFQDGTLPVADEYAFGFKLLDVAHGVLRHARKRTELQDQVRRDQPSEIRYEAKAEAVLRPGG